MSVKLIKNPARQDEPNWKYELANAITSVDELLARVNLEPQQLNAQQLTTISTPGFRLRVPASFVANMRLGDIHDPLLRQILPTRAENTGSGLLDPVADLEHMPSPGLLHKYHGRVLLITTGACAVHCRYCFRRNFPYSEASISGAHWQAALDYIRAHEEIQEVILSGGDPLVLDDHKLDRMQRELAEIAHLKYLRIHSRLPVVLASRVNPSLLSWLEQSRFRISMVIHTNHGNELGRAEQNALEALRGTGAALLNQSVLLHQINDTAEALITLSQRLHDCGVLPYYLHLLDKTRGAMHFDVPESHGVQIIAAMRAKLPGYLVPRLVRELAGENSKTAIFGI